MYETPPVNFSIFYYYYSIAKPGEDRTRANARAWVRVRVPTRRQDLMDFRWDHVRVPTSSF